MKHIKSLIIAAVLCPSVLLTAQVVNPTTTSPSPAPASTIFPNQGTFMFEVNLKPFSGNNVISVDKFQAKYRICSQASLRLGLYIDNQTAKVTKDDYDSKEKYPSTGNQKSFTYGILPGIEYHFLKNSKISPYCAAEFSYMKQNASSTTDGYEYNYNGSTEQRIYNKYDVQGGWLEGISSTGASLSQRAYHSYGANLIFGTDFYFVKNMYFGFEVGVSYNHNKYEQGTVEQSTTVQKLTVPSYNSSELKLYSNSALRLGVWF